MKYHLPVCVGLLAWTPPAAGQLCGDANCGSALKVDDPLYVMDYLRGFTHDPSIDLANADCDGIAGVTIVDAVRLSNYQFYLDPLECEDTGACAVCSLGLHV